MIIQSRLASRSVIIAVTLLAAMTAAWAAPATALYEGENNGLQGNWPLFYGNHGYVIPNGPAQNPMFGTVSVTGALPYTWAAQTSDPRALVTDLVNTPPLTRIASAFTQYQSKGFTINFTSLNGVSELVSLYLLDFDHAHRTQTVTIRDASTNVQLDQRTFTNFDSGLYEVWLISGNVTITVQAVGYSMPAVSGIFFGVMPPPNPTVPNTSPSTATFKTMDLTTQGNWKGVYGANGYMIANNGALPPTYATADVGGDPTFFAYTWGAGAYLTDPRALQTSSGRIASEYTNYQSKSFNVDININDGGTHTIALYMLDWDTPNTRLQSVTIRDLSTGTLLDSRIFNNFHNGVYALWDIKGNVVITVQASDSTTPSVSGVFFN